MLWLLLVELIGAGGFLFVQVFVQVAWLISRGARLLTRFGKLQALAVGAQAGEPDLFHGIPATRASS